jgi:transcriptional regulator with XRE-family HTH domain
MVDRQTFYIELGRCIREARLKNNLTQEALAALVSLTRTSVTNIEKGRQQVLVHTLLDIATALGVPPDVLLPKTKPSPLDEILKDRSPQEREWVKAIIDNAIGQ